MQAELSVKMFAFHAPGGCDWGEFAREGARSFFAGDRSFNLSPITATRTLPLRSLGSAP